MFYWAPFWKSLSSRIQSLARLYTLSVVFLFEGAGCAGGFQRGVAALGPGTVTLHRLSHPGGGLNHSSGWAEVLIAGNPFWWWFNHLGWVEWRLQAQWQLLWQSSVFYALTLQGAVWILVRGGAGLSFGAICFPCFWFLWTCFCFHLTTIDFYLDSTCCFGPNERPAVSCRGRSVLPSWSWRCRWLISRGFPRLTNS